jgi:putative NIF3 family GTP cyclohydrolase 1 type 2
MSVSMRQIREHMFGLATWVDPEETVDQIVHGDPDRQVTRIGLGWTPCAQNLEAAAADGCELFVSHETFFYGLWGPDLESREAPWGRRRMRALERNDMACMNLHDTWDNFPEHGMRDAWRAFLGLTDLIEERPYYRAGRKNYAPRCSLALCRVKPQTLGEFASFVAARCSAFPSSQGVTVHGDLAAPVERVASGVGCHIPSLEMLELGADVLIVCFDRARQTTIRIPLAEMGANMLVVEHGTSEMPGMQRMTEYLRNTFEGVETAFYCEEPAGVTVGG